MVSDLGYTSQISHFLMQDVSIISAALTKQSHKWLVLFYTLYLQYISVEWTFSPLFPSDNTSFWPLNKLAFHFYQVTWTISNSNLKNPFQRLLSVAPNILSAIWICSFCSLGASHQFSHTVSILFLLQYPTTRNSHVTNIHQCVQKKKKKGYPNSNAFYAAAHKTRICNWGVMEK